MAHVPILLIEIQGMLYANIVLVGGNARLPGYKKRIAHDLRQLTPSEYEIRVGIDNEYVFCA